MAQVLPQTGSDDNVTVRPDLAPVPLAPAGAPVWQFTPAIELQQEWTNDAVPGGTRAQPSFITVLTPSLAASGDSARASGSLLYAPSLYYYNSLSAQNRITQNFDGSGHVTLLPEQVFLDLHGFAGTQSVNGATAPTGTTTLSRQNQLQDYSFSVTPYATHRFGAWGTVKVGATLSDTVQDSLAASQPGAGSINQDLRSAQETASFTSGENFGRWISNVQLSAIQDSGSGPLAGAHRDTASYQAGYAITHAITALASVGWEDIAYTGSNPYRIDDATWSVGTRLTPNADSSITVLYGHQDGASAASLDASYAPGAHIKLFARYSEGVTTATEELQNSLANAQLDPLGNPVDATSGAPLQLTNNFFGANGSVYLARSASLTAAWQFDRDSFQATVNHEQRTPVAGQQSASSTAFTRAALASGADQGTYGSLAWQHELSEDLKSGLFVQYGVDTIGSGPTRLTSDLLVVSASLTHAFSDTLTGTAQYSFNSNAYTGAAQSSTIHLVVLGLRKTF